MTSNKLINAIINKQSLEIFNVGCNKVNFDILQDIIKEKKMTLKQIGEYYNLSTMPANRRINMLVEVGLVNRINRKQEVIPTKLALVFIDLIANVRKYLKKGISTHMEDFILRG